MITSLLLENFSQAVTHNSIASTLISSFMSEYCTNFNGVGNKTNSTITDFIKLLDDK